MPGSSSGPLEPEGDPGGVRGLLACDRMAVIAGAPIRAAQEPKGLIITHETEAIWVDGSSARRRPKHGQIVLTAAGGGLDGQPACPVRRGADPSPRFLPREELPLPAMSGRYAQGALVGTAVG